MQNLDIAHAARLILSVNQKASITIDDVLSDLFIDTAVNVALDIEPKFENERDAMRRTFELIGKMSSALVDEFSEIFPGIFFDTLNEGEELISMLAEKSLAEAFSNCYNAIMLPDVPSALTLHILIVSVYAIERDGRKKNNHERFW